MSAAEEIPVRAFEPDEIPAARRAGHGEGQRGGPSAPGPAAAADEDVVDEPDTDAEDTEDGDFDEPVVLELEELGGELEHEDADGEAAPPAATSFPLRRPPRQGGPHAEAHARARELFARLNELPEGSTERKQIRDELVQMHLPLVEHLARRFRNRGEPLDDLTQVATIGLIKSVDRFDTERGVEFSTYATPTVIGEIKRHFRDKGWAVRVPRRLQELRLSLTSATSELSQRNRRSPTVAELAEYLKISEEEVLEGLESANAYSTLSLDVSEGGDEDSPAVADSLGSEDEALEGVEYRESLKPLLEQLPPREKKILLLRFFGNMTQSQIAEEIGISQMHVSRLLARTLEQLRAQLLVDE
ncbi:RNA polymerase sigma-B factor [Catenulispora sp. GP43]|uniref:RNA polymerase sigma factor SigF n=1 Tax=Catenulispora sp. GP43 TaxID=3156263 RepID=UPI003513977B